MESMSKSRWSKFTGTIAEFPLEWGLFVWGLYIGITSITGFPPSLVLSRVPQYIDTLWGAFSIMAAVMVAIGITTRKSSIILSNALVQFAIVFAAYAVASIGTGSTREAGVASSLTIVMAIVCLIRANQIKKFLLLIQGRAEVKIDDRYSHL